MEQQGYSNEEGSMTLADLMTTMSQFGIFVIFKKISTNFDWITGLISQGGQFMWNVILQACLLSLEVTRQMSMTMVDIIFDGEENRFHLLKESLKKTGMTILNIGQAVRQVFKNYWVNQDDAFHASNVNLQETEPAEEEQSNQPNSGEKTPGDDEESDISLD